MSDEELKSELERLRNDVLYQKGQSQSHGGIQAVSRDRVVWRRSVLRRRLSYFMKSFAN
jgi:hypothetical protein